MVLSELFLANLKRLRKLKGTEQWIVVMMAEFSKRSDHKKVGVDKLF